MRAVSRRKRRPIRATSSAALVEFESGATGLMATVRAAPVYWRCAVFGTDGMAEARGEDTLIVGKIGGPTEERKLERVDSLRVLLEAFADAIEGKAPFPVRPEQMLNLIGAFEAVITSLEKGAPVKLLDSCVPGRAHEAVSALPVIVALMARRAPRNRTQVFLSKSGPGSAAHPPSLVLRCITALRAHAASRLATFMRDTLSPARWFQMKASRTSLSVWWSMAQPSAPRTSI